MKNFTFYIEDIYYGEVTVRYPDETTDDEALEYMRDEIMNKGIDLPDARIGTCELIQ